MSYLKDSLSANEVIVDRFSLHWVVWFKVWVMWAVCIIAPIAAYFGSQDIRALYALAITIPFALVPHLNLRFMEYGLTNRRVVFKKGIVARNTEEMKISTIETVEIKQTFIGRLMGFGNILVSGVGVSDVLFKMVVNPMSVKKKIEEQRYQPVT